MRVLSTFIPSTFGGIYIPAAIPHTTRLIYFGPSFCGYDYVLNFLLPDLRVPGSPL